MLCALKMRKPDAERFISFMREEEGVPDGMLSFADKKVRTFLRFGDNDRKEKVFKEFWVKNYFEDECIIEMYPSDYMENRWDNALYAYGRKYPETEYFELRHIGTCDGYYDLFDYRVGETAEWGFSQSGDYYEYSSVRHMQETDPDSSGSRREFAYNWNSWSNNNNPKVVWYEDADGSHLECTYVSKALPLGSETLYLNSSPAESLEEMIKEQQEDLTCYLDATRHGMNRTEDAPNAFVYGDYATATLFKIETALIALQLEL